MKQYKLIINQDAVFKTTWHGRYSIAEELDDDQQPSTLPGAVIKCGKWDKSEMASCDTDIFPCLFNIEKGTLTFEALKKIPFDFPCMFCGKSNNYKYATLSPDWCVGPCRGKHPSWGPVNYVLEEAVN